MRILHVINELSIGGAERLIVETIPFYEISGIKVDLLLLNDSDTAFKNQLKQTMSGNIIGLTKGPLYNNRLLYNPSLIFKIAPYLRKYDIIHAHLFPTLYWVAIAKCIRFSNIPIVYTEHNTYNRRRDNFILKHIDKFIYSKINKIISISSEVEENIKKHLSSKGCFRIINNGVNTSIYSNARGYPKEMFFAEDDFILIQVSSFRKQKDQKTLIKSLLFLSENIKLILVGDGPEKTECENLVKELNLKTRVTFLGLRYDVPEILKMSDLVILSSHYEGFGLAAVEGMASGKPVIASNVEGLSQIVKGAGLVFEVGNAEELAQIITSLLDDENNYQRISGLCYERAKSYDINSMVKAYIETYNSVLKDSKL